MSTSGSDSDNALNQKRSETVNYGALTKSFSYDYTANGLKKFFTMPDGKAYDYARACPERSRRSDNNELREIRLPGTGAISYPSYTWTRPDAVLYPGGGRREYSYDPLMRITRITAKDPGKNIVLDYSYTYDTMDNILSKQTGQGTYNYTYDSLYRLTDVPVNIPGQENEGFSYDAVGNRLTEEGVEGEWAYNDNNELLAFANTEYTYDDNGNAKQLLLDGTVMFTYHHNAQDRLVQVDDVNGSTIAEYAYDPFGRRLWKEVGGTRTYFFYADEGLVAEYDASGTEIRAYGYRPDSMWTTDPLWLKQGGEYYFYLNDHLGTPQKLVQMNGAIAWSASYTAFGKATVEVDTVVNNLRFPGQYFDAETGLHYNCHRYYDVVIGRYLRPDLIDHRYPGNYYLYANANPGNMRDSLGLIPSANQVIGATVGAVIGGVIGYTVGAVVGTVGGIIVCAPSGIMALGCAVTGGVSLAGSGGMVGSVAGALIGILLTKDPCYEIEKQKYKTKNTPPPKLRPGKKKWQDPWKNWKSACEVLKAFIRSPQFKELSPTVQSTIRLMKIFACAQDTPDDPLSPDVLTPSAG